jgi:flagellar hook-associated protein 1 FlgK
MFPTNILGSLQIGRRALVAHQIALTTVGHNLANAATPGYSRQRTELVPASPRGGVDVQEIRRIRDRFLDFALVAEQQSLGRSRARDGILQRLEAVFTDAPGTGLSAVMDQLFQSFQDLSMGPAELALRVAVKDRAELVAATFRGLRARLDQLKADLTAEIQQRVTEANALLGQIADLHRQIVAARGGPTPNDLLDRRDYLVAQLAQIVGVSAADRPDGTMQLALTGSGVLLLDGTLVAPLAATVNGAGDTVDLTAGAAALPVTVASGALAALLETRNQAAGGLKQAAADLDTLARAFIAEVNRVHASGAGLTQHTTLTAVNAVSSAAAPLDAAGLPYAPTSGSFRIVVHDGAGVVASTVTVTVAAGVTTLEDLRAAIDADPNLTATIAGGKLTVSAAAGMTFTFAADTSDALMALGLNTFFVGSDARSIAVNPLVASDATKIAAARADAAGLVHPGDGTNALALAQLRARAALNGGTTTFVDFYGTLVSRVGSLKRAAATELDRQQAAVRLVENLQQQTSGVSTDEELIALTESQHAYAAAARFVATIDEVLDALLRLV